MWCVVLIFGICVFWYSFALHICPVAFVAAICNKQIIIIIHCSLSVVTVNLYLIIPILSVWPAPEWSMPGINQSANTCERSATSDCNVSSRLFILHYCTVVTSDTAAHVGHGTMLYQLIDGCQTISTQTGYRLIAICTTAGRSWSLNSSAPLDTSNVFIFAKHHRRCSDTAAVLFSR